MKKEERTVKLQVDKRITVEQKLILMENIPEDSGMVTIKLIEKDKAYIHTHDNYFSALVDLRRELEKEDIQVLCNGAAKNVYPSPMQFSMGNTRKAYKTTLGKPARITDMVDIFDCDEELEFVSIKEQLQFNKIWIDSISK